jgi:hypothetical protein
MEILCLNCQRKLTIPEQYAGQQMKCPMCQSVFTAPALPTEPAPGIMPAPPLTLPSLELSPAPTTTPASTPAPAPPAPGITPPGAAPPPAGATPPATTTPPTPTAPPTPSAPLDYTGKFSMWISPRYVQFVPLAAMLLILVLTIFPWVGVFYGSYRVDSQNAWTAAFGSVSTNSDYDELSFFKEGKKSGLKVEPVGWNVLTLFYLLGLFATLLVVIAAVALDFTGKYLPPQAEKFTRWRWVAVAVVTLLTFFVFLLQDVIPFSMESRVADAADKQAKALEEMASQAGGETEKTRRYTPVLRSEIVGHVHTTMWFRWVRWLHFWALVFSVLVMLAGLRHPRPCPRVDLWW